MSRKKTGKADLGNVDKNLARHELTGEMAQVFAGTYFVEKSIAAFAGRDPLLACYFVAPLGHPEILSQLRLIRFRLHSLFQGKFK